MFQLLEVQGKLKIKTIPDDDLFDNDGLERGSRIPMIEYVNVSSLPDDFELGVDSMFATKFDLQKAVNMVVLRKNFAI